MIEQLFDEIRLKLKELFDRVSQLEAATNEGTGSGAAPSDAQYLVNAANADLSNEIVVTAVRGRIIYGDNTPTWITLAHPAAANRVLTTDANDVLWSANTLNIAGNSTINGSLTGGGTVATGGFTGTIPATATFAMGAGTLSVSSANNVATATHTHAITSSSNPGAAASILASNASGQLTLEDLFVNDDGIVGVSGDVRIIFDSSLDHISMMLTDSSGTSRIRVLDSTLSVIAFIDSDGGAVFGNNSQVTGEVYLQSEFASTSLSQLGIHSNDSGLCRMQFTNTTTGTTATDGIIFGLTAAELGQVYNYENTDFRFGTNNAEVMRLFTTGDVAIGTTSAPANGGQTLTCADNTNDPTPPANSATFYAKDVGGTTEAFAVDEAGNASQLTSHSPIWPSNLAVSAIYPQVNYDQNSYLGKKRYIAKAKAMELLQQMLWDGGYLPTDEYIVITEDMPKSSWYARQAVNKLDAENKNEAYKIKAIPEWIKERI